MRGADCDSDHFLVREKIKIKLKKRITTKLTIVNRYDISDMTRFKNETHKCSKYLNIDRTGSINTMWKKIHDTIKEALAEVLGKLRNTNNFGLTKSVKGH